MIWICRLIKFYLFKSIIRICNCKNIFFCSFTTYNIFDSDSIFTIIGTKHKEEKFLIACVDSTKTDLSKRFAKTTLHYSSAVFIKTLYSDLKEMDLSKYQMIVFYSPSDIKSLLENFPDFKQGDMQFATFGPATAKALKSAKLTTTITAPTPEAPSIAKALSIYLDK